MSTKESQARFDCYANAEPDEEMFILLARDKSAPQLVRMWAYLRQQQIKAGQKPQSDLVMVEEACQCADKMEAWRKANRHDF